MKFFRTFEGLFQNPASPEERRLIYDEREPGKQNVEKTPAELQAENQELKKRMGSLEQANKVLNDKLDGIAEAQKKEAYWPRPAPDGQANIPAVAGNPCYQVPECARVWGSAKDAEYVKQWTSNYCSDAAEKCRTVPEYTPCGKCFKKTPQPGDRRNVYDRATKSMRWQEYEAGKGWVDAGLHKSAEQIQSEFAEVRRQAAEERAAEIARKNEIDARWLDARASIPGGGGAYYSRMRGRQIAESIVAGNPIGGPDRQRNFGTLGSPENRAHVDLENKRIAQLGKDRTRNELKKSAGFDIGGVQALLWGSDYARNGNAIVSPDGKIRAEPHVMDGPDGKPKRVFMIYDTRANKSYEVASADEAAQKLRSLALGPDSQVAMASPDATPQTPPDFEERSPPKARSAYGVSPPRPKEAPDTRVEPPASAAKPNEQPQSILQKPQADKEERPSPNAKPKVAPPKTPQQKSESPKASDIPEIDPDKELRMAIEETQKAQEAMLAPEKPETQAAPVEELNPDTILDDAQKKLVPEAPASAPLDKAEMQRSYEQSQLRWNAVLDREFPGRSFLIEKNDFGDDSGMLVKVSGKGGRLDLHLTYKNGGFILDQHEHNQPKTLRIPQNVALTDELFVNTIEEAFGVPSETRKKELGVDEVRAPTSEKVSKQETPNLKKVAPEISLNDLTPKNSARSQVIPREEAKILTSRQSETVHESTTKDGFVLKKIGNDIRCEVGPQKTPSSTDFVGDLIISGQKPELDDGFRRISARLQLEYGLSALNSEISSARGIGALMHLENALHRLSNDEKQKLKGASIELEQEYLHTDMTKDTINFIPQQTADEMLLVLKRNLPLVAPTRAYLNKVSEMQRKFEVRVGASSDYPIQDRVNALQKLEQAMQGFSEAEKKNVRDAKPFILVRDNTFRNGSGFDDILSVGKDQTDEEMRRTILEALPAVKEYTTMIKALQGLQNRFGFKRFTDAAKASKGLEGLPKLEAALDELATEKYDLKNIHLVYGTDGKTFVDVLAFGDVARVHSEMSVGQMKEAVKNAERKNK